MARKSGGVNKSLAIRTYKSNHRKAGPKEIVAALKAEGIDVSPAFVSTVLSNARRKGGKRGRKAAAAPAGRGDKALASLIQAKKLSDAMGGIDKARAALDALAKILG
jgi:hypothetical protein